MNSFDNQFLAYIVMLHDWLNQPAYISLFMISFLASTLLPLGSEWLLITMLVAGYNPLAVLATATIGNYLGGVTTYLIGIYGGVLLTQKILRISVTQQTRAKKYYQKFGVYSLLFSWLPIIGDPLCLTAGILRIDFWLFSLLVLVGKFTRYAITTIITLNAAG